MDETVPIYIHSSHGIFKFLGRKDETLGSALKRSGIPLSAVTTYLVVSQASKKLSGSMLSFISASHPLNETIKTGSRIVVQLARNISLPSLLTGGKTFLRKVDNPVAEWIFPDRDKGAFYKILSQLSSNDCLNIVSESVKEVLNKLPKNTSKRMVVGVSGGGDSNVLLSTLLKSGLVKKSDIFPVMMLGIPDWDRQKEQAKELCQNLALNLEIVEPEQVAKIVSVSSLSELIKRFKKHFSDADLEFLGTFLLRRVLSYYAKLHKAKYVAIGANREDLVSEGLARIGKGLLPLPAPFRKIGSVTFVYPMWKVPKKIGDGAFPRYSLVNYENRNPSYSEGRCLYYYITYALSEVCPGLDLTLLEGFSKLAAKEKKPIVKERTLNDFVCKDKFTAEQLKKWKDLFDLV